MKYFMVFTCLIAFLLFANRCTSHYREKRDSIESEYCYKINSLIKDVDFKTAKIENSKILLYNEQNELINEIEISDVRERIKLISIRKKDNIVYYVINSWIGDESGIMFVNDESDAMMNGLHYVERLGGNSYRFDTAPR